MYGDLRRICRRNLSYISLKRHTRNVDFIKEPINTFRFDDILMNEKRLLNKTDALTIFIGVTE